MNPVVVNVGLGRWYPRGCIRLRDSLKATNPNVDILQWIDEYPPNSPSHQVSPYAFKVAAFRHAASLGYELILWCDSSLWATGSLEPFFTKLAEQGHVLQANGWACGQWCSDRALEPFGITRDEAMEIPDYTGCCMGLNVTHERTREFLRRLYKKSKDGFSFPGSWTNKNQEVSADPRVLGHRHDQVIGSLIAWQMGMELTSSTEGILAYYHAGMPPVPPSVVMFNQGM